MLKTFVVACVLLCIIVVSVDSFRPDAGMEIWLILAVQISILLFSF